MKSKKSMIVEEGQVPVKVRSPLNGKWYVVGVVSLADGSYISAPQITQNPANYANDVRSFYRSHPEMSVSQYPGDYCVTANEIGVTSPAQVYEFSFTDKEV